MILKPRTVKICEHSIIAQNIINAKFALYIFSFLMTNGEKKLNACSKKLNACSDNEIIGVFILSF